MKLYSVNLSGLTVGQPVPKNEIPAPDAVKDIENVITSVAWQNNDSLISVWMNRVQNQAYLQSCINSNCNMVRKKLTLSNAFPPNVNEIFSSNRLYLPTVGSSCTMPSRSRMMERNSP